MQNDSSEGGSQWKPWTFITKCAGLAVPWGVVENALTRYRHPDAGYCIGILTGLCCMYAIPPRDTAIWRFLVIGAVGILLRLTLH
jgi:hypothetical protein